VAASPYTGHPLGDNAVVSCAFRFASGWRKLIKREADQYSSNAVDDKNTTPYHAFCHRFRDTMIRTESSVVEPSLGRIPSQGILMKTHGDNMSTALSPSYADMNATRDSSATCLVCEDSARGAGAAGRAPQLMETAARDLDARPV
jgi:hypothetical protein